MANPLTTEYTVQTPTLTLHEIADVLWTVGHFDAYRSLMAYIKERDLMLKSLQTYERLPR